MLYLRKATVLLLICACLSSCSKYPKEVQEALNLSGANKQELEKVIDHYSKNPADSLKLKSAYFLIGNMTGKYYYQGDLLEKYYGIMGNIENIEAVDSIAKIYGAFSTDSLEIKYDIRELSSSFLINNIDMAFKVWNEQPWGKNINFEQFCEYILPYRVGNEIPDYNRAEIYARYNKSLDSIRNKNGDAVLACFALNNVLIKEPWYFSLNGAFLPSFSAKKLATQKGGNCRDMVAKTIFTMRALGIPVGSEYTPNWGNRNGDHLWNVVLDKKGKHHSFMGTENNNSRELVGGKVYYTFPKVFLNTFSKQSYASDLVADNKNDIPFVFKNNFRKDVTNENDGCKDVRIQLNDSTVSNYKYAFICVFDNANWVPVHWAKIIKNEVIFTNMMPGITYLVAYFKNDVIIPTDAPFLLDKSGAVKYWIPNKLVRQTLTLERKYPILMKEDYQERMEGGKFQASDNANFDGAITFYKIPYPKVEMKWYNAPVKLARAYKYYRYLSPEEGWGNVAELAFYSKGIKIKGEIIGTKGSYNNNPKETYTSAMDGDELTFFDYDKPANGWVGLKFNVPVKVDEIRFLPRNDDNGIAVGQEYELFYWEHSKWISAGKKTGNDTMLVYKNIPTDALYLLRNHSKGKEERIFSYVKGKQIWW